MKKPLIPVIAFLCSIASLQAQESSENIEQKIKFGVKGGVNFANYIGDDTDELEARTSFHVGGVMEVMISEKFSFQPEVLYSSQGTKSEIEDSGFNIDVKEKADYLNIPLMAKFYATEAFIIEAGPQIGFLLSAEQKGSVNEEGIDISVSQDVKDMRNSIDFGLNLGLGYKLSNGLNFGARYNLGLSDINDEEDYDGKNQNSVLQLSIGFMF